MPIKKEIVIIGLFLITILSACTNTEPAEKSSNDNNEKEPALKNNIELSVKEAAINEEVHFTIDDLDANTDVQLEWTEVEGTYKIENLYEFIGTKYSSKDVPLVTGTSDENGKWEGTFKVPQGFGGNHTLYITSDNKKIGQKGFFVRPKFSITPESGPVGTEVALEAEGLDWKTYKSMWNLTYDNKYTGMVSGVSTQGKTKAIFRASGSVGKHFLSLRSGYLGSPYINHESSPHTGWPAPDFVFEITDEDPIAAQYVEKTPKAASGGVEMPKLKNKKNVEVSMDKEEGIVGEKVALKASNLPKNKEVELVWNTMKGSRVTDSGFDEESAVLDTIKTDAEGNAEYKFEIPDDLGGLPHRIDLQIGDEIYGQTYLRITPSIVEITPSSGPQGTEISVTIKGGGWTEYDNAYYLTYDNAYSGYMCAFNSQGTLEYKIIATGELGYHVIDMYPGIYQQQEIETDMTLIPQLTYREDHPGSAMPAIRYGFEITEK
ncbi:hypothetical protein DVB69_00275 [Sporosarcina sp. BI001-red]|uniref:hypothetical protein n=1 Tax=Sporosarcina sp. BI001-red TaxID=2282866 RepID=UPI000E22E573|nr:hypothetical protein [Sporosarcina sp. BI001-red]REB11616.1 hypothetical protein DVB69_00275 [Sporosarcina sp. BI001-red]